jgi:hypothetical protein
MAPAIVTKWAEYCEANYSRELPENRQLREVIKRVQRISWCESGGLAFCVILLINNDI